MRLDHKENIQTRREFLQTLSLFSGSALFLSVPWLSKLSASEKDNPAVSDRVRLGVIGVGSRGKHLAEHLLINPEADVVAICDDYQPSIDSTLNLFKDSKKPDVYYDYRKMLERKDIDAVIVATPLHLHKEMTVDCLEAGKHVMMEKSMAKSIEDCHEIVMKHKETACILFIGHQRLCNLVYLDAIQRHRTGEFGKINMVKAFWHRNNDWRRSIPSPELERRINWRLYPEYSCGLMTELASHQTQVSNWFLGEIPTQVFGSGSINYWKDGRQVHDNVNLVYTYPSGTHLMYDSIISNGHYGLEEQILTKDYTLELEKNKLYMENPPAPAGILQLINNIEKDIFETVPIGGASWVPEIAGMKKGAYLLDKYPLPGDTGLLMQSFVEAVKRKEQPPEIVEQGYYGSVTALMGYEAIMENKIVKMPEEFIL